MFQLDDAQTEAGFSREREEEALACLPRLRYALNEVNVGKVKESAQKMVKQRMLPPHTRLLALVLSSAVRF